ncbi:MAG: glutamate/tyrosine decarboxylase-like PLP-dependent enzyme [Candidatus Paceibacteria bacterium]|jgi:glutamate/tyrosine decarboxylase-like PLP-dependent enzyme
MKDKKIYENVSFVEIKKELNTELTEDPIDDIDAFMISAEKFTPNQYDAKNSGRLYSSIDPYALEGQRWATNINAPVGTMSGHPVAIVAEYEVIELLRKKIGYSQAEGLGVSGGSAGNFEGINIARYMKFPEMKKHGNGQQQLHVYVSKDGHYSVRKAAQFLGIGIDNVIEIETNEKGEMLSSKLEEAIVDSEKKNAIPLVIISTAGTTVGGSFDPIHEINKIAKIYNIYHHVDASWGGAGLFTAEPGLIGINETDSITFDAHKAIGAGVTSAFFITKHVDVLYSANSVSADYIKAEISEYVGYDTLDMSQQCGRRAHVFGFYFQVRALGAQGITKRIGKFYEQTRYIAKNIQAHPEMTMLQSSYLNTCFQVTSPLTHFSNSQFTNMVHQTMEREAFYKVGRGTWKGKSVIRYVTINPNTSLEDIDNFITYMVSLRGQLLEEHALQE